MFNNVLIANRGEIACRVIETCRELGVATVAVHSDVDADARHVRMADESVRLGPAAAAESYLNVERILAAARETGAEAIHPGYGFLSENADFVRACDEAGVVFIGPRPETIDRMGSKSASKALMIEAGVPVVPGYHGADQDRKTLLAEAKKIGYPLMIKAVSGGGGKGMRVVHEAGELEEALDGARREGESSFGDGRLLLEKYVEQPRHVEFQVIADQHGQTIHLFERECSLQRRYQKIVEETPSPALDPDLRERMAEAAVAAAEAVDYVNAGTVEFILGADGEFHFMEMNTRLQVEHPVTEMVTGLDLVEWQLRVAAGEPLPLAQEDIDQVGHAIEVRIYAEKPEEGFLPSIGRVSGLDCPLDEPGVRLDTGVEAGDEISIHYDPMIAKLVVHGDDRPAALRRLRRVLARTAVFGPETNLGLLRAIAKDPAFNSGEFDTGTVAEQLETWLTPDPAPSRALMAAAVYRALSLEVAGEDDLDPHSPWARPDGWQLVPGNGLRVRLESAGTSRDVRLLPREQDAWVARIGRIDQVGDESHELSLHDIDGDALILQIGDRNHRLDIFAEDDRLMVADGEQAWMIRREAPYAPASVAGADEAHPGSPMPGRIVAVHVAEGDSVEAGQPILVLEGMKMEYTVKAGVAGTVEKIKYSEGDMVDAEVPLVDIQPE